MSEPAPKSPAPATRRSDPDPRQAGPPQPGRVPRPGARAGNANAETPQAVRRQLAHSHRLALYDPQVIELRELTDEHHEIAERFWQFFLHDLSGFRDSHPDEHGSFKRRHLEPFLVHDADRVAYLVYGPSGPVGFAFVYGLASEVRRFDQFFIVRSQRRAGVGRAAAEAAIRRHPGRWEVAFQNENRAAASFWRRLAAEIGSNVHERLQPVPNKPHVPDDVILSFETA